MKKSNFTLKNIGSEIVILFNGKPLKRISNYKKALKFIALYATHKNINNFDLFVWEKNKLEKIKDFDPEIMINHSEGKINTRRNGQVGFSEFMDDDDDIREMRNLLGRGDEDNYENLMRRHRRGEDFDGDDDFNFDRNDFDRDDRNNFDRRDFRGPSRPQWTYQPSDTSSDLEKIKKNMKSIFARLS